MKSYACYSAAGDGNSSTRRPLAATDTRTAVLTCSGHDAASDGDTAPRSENSATNTRSLNTASCVHYTAVNGNRTAKPTGPKTTVTPTADTRTVVAAGCGHSTAVNGNGATCLPVVSANPGIMTSHVLCNQLTHIAICGLGVDGQAVGASVFYICITICHLDSAIDGKSIIIRQNQVDITFDGDAAADFNRVSHNVPAACGAAVHCYGVSCDLRNGGGNICRYQLGTVPSQILVVRRQIAAQIKLSGLLTGQDLHRRADVLHLGRYFPGVVPGDVLGVRECVNEGLHRADMADIAAELAEVGGDIAALAVMLVLTGYALHLRDITATLTVDDLAVLACFVAIHIAEYFRYSLHKAAVLGVFLVMRAQAPAVLLRRQGRRRKQSQHKNTGQEN